MTMAGCKVGRICIYLWAICIIVMLSSLVVGCQCAAFNDFFYPSWAVDHVMSQGDLLQLKLDHASGICLFYFFFLISRPLLLLVLIMQLSLTNAVSVV